METARTSCDPADFWYTMEQSWNHNPKLCHIISVTNLVQTSTDWLSRQDNDRTRTEKKVEKMKYSGVALRTLWPLITKYGRALVDVFHHELLKRCFISTIQSLHVKTIFALSDILIDKICLVFHLFRLVRTNHKLVD